MKYIRTRGEKVDLGHVELDFTPETLEETDTAVPRARIMVRGSDKALEIRDPERVQRLREMLWRPLRVRSASS